MNDDYEPSVAALAVDLKADNSILVAVAYWCDESWAICAGKDLHTVQRAAVRYLEMFPCKYNDKGNFVNGKAAEGYWIMKVPLFSMNLGDPKPQLLPTPLKTVLDNSIEKADALRAERESRPSKLHANDKRIATEIAALQFELGQWRRELILHNIRCEENVVANHGLIAQINSADADLAKEMSIALHQTLMPNGK